MSILTISPFNFDIPCEIYGCSKRARYVIGPEGMQTANSLYVCEDCYSSLVKKVFEMEKPEPIAIQVKDEKLQEETNTEQPIPDVLKPNKKVKK